jgi:hypothetical protein
MTQTAVAVHSSRLDELLAPAVRIAATRPDA